MELEQHRLHEGLRTAHNLLRFALADRRRAVVAFMPESEQIR